MEFKAVHFAKKAYFNEVRFYKKANFLCAHISNAYFINTVFLKQGLLTNLDIESVIIFDNAVLKDVSFIDTDLRKTVFINCAFRRHFGRDVLYDEDYILVRDVLCDEDQVTVWFKKYICRLKNWFSGIVKITTSIRIAGSFDTEKCKEYKKVEILYRRLKQASIDAHDYDAASDWHYGEKEMHRKGKVAQMRFFGPFFPYLLSLYWFFSGYGEKRIRAFVVLFFFGDCLIVV